MELSQVDLKSITDEVRYRIFEYLWSKGFSSRELGIDPTYANKIRNRKVKVSDNLLARMLQVLSIEEFAELVSGSMPKTEVFTSVKDLGSAALALDSALRQLDEVLSKYPQLSNVAYMRIMELVRGRIRNYSIAITEEYITRFEKLLSTKAPKTKADRLRYLRRALRDLNYELSPDRLQEYVAELYEESPHVAQHIAKTLKLFIKHVIRDPNLYSSFKTPKTETLAKDVVAIGEIREVAKAIEWPPAKAYFILLAETGLRPGEVLNARLDDLDLNKRILWIRRVGTSKRSYFSFFSEGLKKYLKEVYIPYRDSFVDSREGNVRNLLRESIDEWRMLLFPFKDSSLRSAIYAAMDEALGRRFRLYDLRTHFATYMSLKGVPGQIIDILQGRVPPKEFQVLTKHYLAFRVEDLREVYDKAGLTILLDQ